MISIDCVRWVSTCIDVIGEVCQVVFVPDLLRRINVRDSVKCLRDADVLLNQITSDSSDSSLIIYNCDVSGIIMTVSIININVSCRSRCNLLPEDCSVGKTQSLLIVPVFDCSWSVSSRCG